MTMTISTMVIDTFIFVLTAWQVSVNYTHTLSRVAAPRSTMTQKVGGPGVWEQSQIITPVDSLTEGVTLLNHNHSPLYTTEPAPTSRAAAAANCRSGTITAHCTVPALVRRDLLHSERVHPTEQKVSTQAPRSEWPSPSKSTFHIAPLHIALYYDVRRSGVPNYLGVRRRSLLSSTVIIGIPSWPTTMTPKLLTF